MPVRKVQVGARFNPLSDSTDIMPAPVLISISPDSNILGDAITTINSLVLKGIAAANSWVAIYDGLTLLGSVLADGNGAWTFTTGALADGDHGLFASTATGETSQLAEIAVAPSIASFAAANGSTIKVDGTQYNVQNGNRTWSLSAPDAHTLRFEVAGGDKWVHDSSGSQRSEIAGRTVYAPGEELSVSYNFMVEPGAANTASGPGKWGKWLILSQFHADDLDSSPPFAVEMIGDKLAIVVRYKLPGEEATDAIYLYKDTSDIQRGKYYSLHIEANFRADETGYLRVWLDGVQIADYHGPLGYDNGVYWKEGIYRSSASESIAANFNNLLIATGPVEAGVKPPGSGETIAGTGRPDTVDADHAPDGQPLPTNAGDLIRGKGGKDTLFGLGGDDTILGNGGRDKLFGLAGNDLLDGGSGKDWLEGGEGGDRFYFGSIRDSRDRPDVIADFSQAQGDLIDLSAIDGNKKLAGKQSFTFLGEGWFSGTAGELRFANGKLAGDTNGDGRADFVVKVAGLLSLAATDLVL